jgi:hypothetical protein
MENISLIEFLVYIAIISIMVKVTRKYPAWEDQEIVYLEILVQRDTDRVWKCIKAIEDNTQSPFGSNLRVILLESSGYRISLNYYSHDISEGSEVKLRRRTGEDKNHAWISDIDKVMIPYVISRT